MTLRARLVVWFAAVQAAGLAAFSTLVWFSMRHAIVEDLDRWLRAESAGLERFIRDERILPGLPGVIEEAREFSTGLPADAGMQILDLSQRVLFRSPSGANPPLPPEGRPVAGRVGGQPVRILLRRVHIGGEGLAILLWRSSANAERQLAFLGWMLVGLSPLILAAAAAGGWWLSRGMLRPVDDLTTAARRVSLQDLSARLPVPGGDPQLARLCEAWNEMLGRLEEAAARQQRFTSDASHELRTPLSFIRASAELALRQQRAPEDYRQALAEIRERTVEMGQILDGLLVMARADAGAAPVMLAQTDWRRPVEEAFDQMRPLAAGKSLDYRLETPGVPLPVLGDSAWLRRLALLLIDNAIKFTPEGGSVQVCLRARGKDYRLEISDTGCGISPQDLPHIFERFYQADPSRSTGGAGLGLSIARWIVEKHSGRIEVDSEPGKGSCFRVSLARAEREA